MNDPTGILIKKYDPSIFFNNEMEQLEEFEENNDEDDEDDEDEDDNDDKVFYLTLVSLIMYKIPQCSSFYKIFYLRLSNFQCQFTKTILYYLRMSHLLSLLFLLDKVI